MSDNRYLKSSFSKWIISHSITKEANDNSEKFPYIANINYKITYIYEQSISTVKSNFENSDNASKRFSTELQAKDWLIEKGVGL